MIIKILVKTEFANLINIFANKMIIQELINFKLNKKNFINEFQNLLSNKSMHTFQLSNIKEYLKVFENDEPPYDICVNRIKKLL